ncbi:MAG: PEP-CTERM sorting domain-containing protein [Alphaproteobacteria bacterium]|nr:MAG: PEP-CTERM sorting domain-containing protein [Alphaproteobacteria bacterium]
MTEAWALAQPQRIAAGTYTLTIAGRAYGAASTFSGNFNVAAVPEPATWAMMIAGVGMAGGALRRRRVTKAEVRWA